MRRDEYFKLIDDEMLSNRARLVVMPTRAEMDVIRQWYACRDNAKVVGVSALVTGREWYPTPDILFRSIYSYLQDTQRENKTLVVVGIDTYSSLLDRNGKKATLEELHKSIDDGENVSLVFLLVPWSSQDLREEFRNPKYKSGMQLIFIDGEPSARQDVAQDISPEIYLVGEEWMTVLPSDVASFQDYLKKMEDGIVYGERVRIAVPASGGKFPGLQDGVTQIMTLADYLRAFYGVMETNLSDQALHRIFALVRDRRQDNAARILYEHFAFKNVCQEVLRKFCDLSQPEQEILLWVLRQYAPQNTYLQRVLEKSGEDFLGQYVCSAVDMLNDSHAPQYAEERREALLHCGSDVFNTAVPQFIKQCASSPAEQVAIWLNNGTELEMVELLRRLRENSSESASKAIRTAYPLLDAYLYDGQVYGNQAVEEYFFNYRKQKVTSIVTEAFVELAFSSVIPSDIKSRDVLLQQYRSDGKTAILIVDALGAEWLPMLLALQRPGIKVQSAQVGYVKLPTSTSINQIAWPEERVLPQIKRLDNIVHSGAEANATRSIDENFAAELDAVGSDVFRAIGRGLASFPKVLVTADHGASRLAMCARKQGLARTLTIGEDAEVLDWRYMRNPKKGKCPEELEETLDGAYWVVRGYNRLPKSGGKIFELHGGATLEERLVPVVVFEPGEPAAFVAKPNTTVTELEEVSDFADL